MRAFLALTLRDGACNVCTYKRRNDVTHTPGPYDVAEDYMGDQGYKVLVALKDPAGGFPTEIARCDHNWTDPDNTGRRISWKEAEGNARLFAAAPDLLAALQDAIIWDSHDSEGHPAVWLDKASAAIAKATG